MAKRTSCPPAALPPWCLNLKVMWIVIISTLGFNLKRLRSVMIEKKSVLTWVGKKRQSYLMINLAPLFLRPRGQTFKMTKWRSDTQSGVPGGWKGWAITQTHVPEHTASGDGGDEMLWEMGMANVIIRPSLLSVPFFLLFCCTFILLHLKDKHSHPLGQPRPLCVIWSRKSRPLSPVWGYWHGRSRLGGEGSANRALSLFWHRLPSAW